MKRLTLALMLLACLAAFCEMPDYRPKFDKTGYCKSVWVHANPWWHPGKRRYDESGGADYAFRCYESSSQWAEALKDMGANGVNLVQWELNIPAPGYANNLKSVIKQCKERNVDCKFGLFAVWCDRIELEKEIERTIVQFEMLKEEMAKDPYIYRLDGCPVISVYTPEAFKPEEWPKVMAAVEGKCGKCIWLMNTCKNPDDDSNPEKLGKFVHSYLPYFDGISQYANYTEESQRRHYEILTPIMHDEYPQKIFEAALHNTYSVHHWFGGAFTHLSRKWRNCIDSVLKANPDSISITNLFDHYEQSHVLPSYERENFLLRYAMAAIGKWRGVPFVGDYVPELALNSYICVQLGRQDLAFEVVGFPIHPCCAGSQPVKLMLDICSTSGQVLYTFPEKTIDVANLSVAEFSVPSEQFAQERGIVPHLRYSWAGKNFTMRYSQMTLIDPSIRTNVMFWSRSTRNQLICKIIDSDWNINGQKAGETLAYPPNGVACITAQLSSQWHQDALNRTGDCYYRIMRNGVEYYQSYKHPGLIGTKPLKICPPGDALNWYHVEIETQYGYRYATLPIWVSSDTRPGTVRMPFVIQGKVEELEVEAARVPFFYYPCNFESGSILADVSGYMHNGGFTGNILDTIGYNHYYNGVGGILKETLFCNDDGRGYLRLKGDRSAIIMGGTAFSGASTYEISVRPAELGKVMGLLGSSNNQLNLTILEDGTVKVQRGAEKEGEGGAATKRKFNAEIRSNTKLKARQWVKIAVIYDLKELQLYINGKLEGKCEAPFAQGHTALNPMSVGSLMGGISNRSHYFKGDIREIRLYGRNLSTDELL